MVYLDDAPSVEVGVLLEQDCPLTGRVVASTLPAGRAAITVHRGSVGNLGAAHDAVHRWCAAAGHQLSRTRFEIYGPHNDDPAQQWTDV